jgi:hypothetical protein
MDKQIADLREKLAERTAQRDELRRIFEQPTGIPRVLAQAPVPVREFTYDPRVDCIFGDAPAPDAGQPATPEA